MHTQRIREESGGKPGLERVILGLLINPDDQRPWGEQEMVLELDRASTSIEVELAGLHRDGLIHRFCGLVTAAHVTVHFDKIEQDYENEAELRLQEVILSLALTSAEPHSSQRRLIRELGEDRELDIIDALDDLELAGLLDRSGDRVAPSQAARRLAQIMQS